VCSSDLSVLVDLRSLRSLSPEFCHRRVRLSTRRLTSRRVS
jgi:hypothetical protein